MNGLILSNQFISRDENMHCTFACELYKLIIHKIDKEDIYIMFNEIIDITKIFIIESLQIELIGINSDSMCEYIQYVADILLMMLGYDPLYNTKNPFMFMESISLLGRVNFFESHSTSYRAFHNEQNINTTNYSLVEDF